MFGDLCGEVTDGDELDGEDVVLTGLYGAEEVGDAELASALLSGEGEAEAFAGLGGGVE